jgi:hypothetical protein
MKLSREDAQLFFKLMWGLQFYVNQRRQILPDIQSLQAYIALQPADKVEVRDVLWENPDLIDAYVAENPDRLSPEELSIVQKWKRFVSGTFYIFRFLKKHTILIGANSQVYGVLGLFDSLDDLFYGHPLPIMVKGVLLPFKGQIVYDGMLEGYSIVFGSGIRSSLKEDYMAARQNDRIITTLEPELAAPARGERTRAKKDWSTEVDQIAAAAEQVKGGPAIQSAAFSLLRASARMAKSAVHAPDDLDELWRLERQVRTALSRLQTTLDRAER